MVTRRSDIAIIFLTYYLPNTEPSPLLSCLQTTLSLSSLIAKDFIAEIKEKEK